MWESWASRRRRGAAFVVLTAATLSGSALASGFSAEQALGSSAGSAPILWHRLPELAFDGQSYVVAGPADRRNLVPSGGGSLFAARVDEHGTLLDPNGIFVSREVALQSIRAVRAPWGTLLVYVNSDGVLATRLNRQAARTAGAPTARAGGGLPFCKEGAPEVQCGCP